MQSKHFVIKHSARLIKLYLIVCKSVEMLLVVGQSCVTAAVGAFESSSKADKQVPKLHLADLSAPFFRNHRVVLASARVLANRDVFTSEGVTDGTR